MYSLRASGFILGKEGEVTMDAIVLFVIAMGILFCVWLAAEIAESGHDYPDERR